MTQDILKTISILILSIFFVLPVNAEKIKNYSSCDVCPGSIYIIPDEARNIMGIECLKQIRKINRNIQQIVKIDLDGVMKNGGPEDTNLNYDIEITSFHNIIYIKSLIDSSYIQIALDDINADRSELLHEWHPEIYLQSSHSNEINLKDTVKDAWKKMKTIHIYEWVFSDKDHQNNMKMLGDKILYSLQQLSEKIR